MSSVGAYKPLDASISWYSEKKDYTYGKFKGGKPTVGHYTQMVWKNTTEVGVTVAVYTNGYIYVAANYSPSIVTRK